MERIDQLKELERNVELGLQKAYKKMVIFKKQMNSPLIVSRNGRVTKIEPENIRPTTTAKKNRRL